MLENIDFANPIVKIITALLGIVMLVSGRKLFWLTVGAIGFVVGLGLVFNFLEDQPAWVTLAAALLAGGVGAIFAILLQKVAVGVAGFLVGGFIVVWLLLQVFKLDLAQWEWLIFITGGIAGAILVLFLFELALIILSSAVGATMIVQIIDFHPLVTAVLFLVLLIVGFAAQSRSLGQRSTMSRNS
jgi:hypothetical protein